jgi:diacylglycerol kinase (ATP)
MRAAAILGLGCSYQNLKPFQDASSALDRAIDWRIGVPSATDGVDVILLFGGDGTVHRHLSQLVQLGLPVLVVPAGSGNDFARALGLRRVSDSLAVWRRYCTEQKNVRAVDLGVIRPLEPGSAGLKAGSRYFCCAAGIGLDGEIVRRANRLPRWLRAHGGYALSLAPALFGFMPFRVKIQTLAGEAHAGPEPRQEQNWLPLSDEPTVLAVFANTPVYGGGMRVAPRARMDDGQLDVCLVTDIDKFKLFCLFPTVYFGRHLSMPEVKYFRSECLGVETEHPLDVYADGELVCRAPVEVAVHSAALRVIVHPARTGF